MQEGTKTERPQANERRNVLLCRSVEALVFCVPVHLLKFPQGCAAIVAAAIKLPPRDRVRITAVLAAWVPMEGAENFHSNYAPHS